MHSTQWWCVAASRMLHCSSKGGAHTKKLLLRRWKELRAAPPLTATFPASSLLAETVAHCEASAAAAASPATSTPEEDRARATTSSLLTTQKNAELIWRVLQRQRVPWQAALRLLPWQLEALSPAQRDFIAHDIAAAASPREVARAVLTAYDMTDVVDAALVQAYTLLTKSTYMVEFARLVTAALRERPLLPGGLLPIPYRVMRHGYGLGQRSPREAAMALELAKHLTLLGRASLSRAAREQLVLCHAALEGQVGNWAAALAVVTQSDAVRLSTRRGYAKYVQEVLKQATNYRDDGGKESFSRLNTSAGDAWTQNTSSLTPTTPISGAITEREALATQSSATWLAGLHAFFAQPADQQTYASARAVLTSLPPGLIQQPDGVVLTAAVLHHAATRMYAGTLTRRLVSSVKRADWHFALSLASAAQCYDVAAPLVPLVSSTTVLPADLRDYMDTTQHIKEQGQSFSSSSGSPSNVLLSPAAAATLTYPQALAYALSGAAASRHAVLSSCPHARPLSRLRSVLLAMRQIDTAGATPGTDTGASTAAVETDDGDAEIECGTFQSSAVSQLVCAAASVPRQQYFFKVIPASARAHHFRVSPLTQTVLKTTAEASKIRSIRNPVSESTVPAKGVVDDSLTDERNTSWSADNALQQWRYKTATTPAACAALLRDLAVYLRTTHTLEGATAARSGTGQAKPRLTEDIFLRCIAQLAAWGAVQLPATERFHWPLAVFKAACLLRVPLDATLVSAAARAVPSVVLDRAALALPAVLTAHTLLGHWQAALQVCARLQRKVEEGLVQLTPSAHGVQRPQTDKFKPPPPSLREAMAQVGYAAPPHVALQHWTALDAAASAAADASVFPLLLIELRQFNDARQLCEEVHRISQATTTRTRVAAQLERLSRRRMLLGAAFAVLNDEAVLQLVVRAAGQQRVRAEDVDSHGLQRLLGVLPVATVRRVVEAEATAGRSAQEHWLLTCLGHLEHVSGSGGDGDAACRLARLRPTSAALSAAVRFHTAAAQGNPVLCLKALRRMAEISLDSPARRALMMCLARLLRVFLSSEELWRACVAASSPVRASNGSTTREAEETAADIATASMQQAQMLFNRLQEAEELSGVLKQARRAVRRTVDPPPAEAPYSLYSSPVTASNSFSPAQQQQQQHTTAHPTPFASVVLLTVLQTALSRVVHLPIPAAFASKLFFRCVADPAVADWRAALFFFHELRHPTNAERVALVQALRPCGGTATSLLLSHRRFMQHLPEQLMLWADEATGPMKWARAIELLTAEESDEGKAHRQSAEEQRDADRRREGVSASPDALSPYVRAAIERWSADECFRAAQLLRRQGFVKIPASSERSLNCAQVMEKDPHARDQVRAILQILQRRTADAEAATTATSNASTKSQLNSRSAKMST